jgi:hypothetical protein
LGCEQADAIPKAWLEERMTVAEAKARYRSTIASGESVPFCCLNDEWEALTRRMRPGDELWRSASPADSWTNLAGRAGVALVRDGRVVATPVTMLN